MFIHSDVFADSDKRRPPILVHQMMLIEIVFCWLNRWDTIKLYYNLTVSKVTEALLAGGFSSTTSSSIFHECALIACGFDEVSFVFLSKGSQYGGA